MLITNLLLCLIIFFLAIIFGNSVEIKNQLSNIEQERMRKFYNTLMKNVKKGKEGKNVN